MKLQLASTIGLLSLCLTLVMRPSFVAADPLDQPPADAKQKEPETEDEILKKAEKLPDLPKIDDKSKIKFLTKDETLAFEKNPAGNRVLIVSEVCLREGLLEVFLCRKNTKEHEAILRADVDASFIHASLIAAGAEPGSTVRYEEEKDGKFKCIPARGTKIKVLVHYKKDGKLHTHAAQEWIQDEQTKKPMAQEWVFAGSRFIKNPGKPDIYTANNGELISISNFVDSMMDLPIPISKDNADLNFKVKTDRIPPILSKVWVILEPVIEKKK